MTTPTRMSRALRSGSAQLSEGRRSRTDEEDVLSPEVPVGRMGIDTIIVCVHESSPVSQDILYPPKFCTPLQNFLGYFAPPYIIS